MCLAIVCAVVGVIGSVLPGLPGAPVSYAGLLLFHFSSAENRIGWVWLVVFGILVAVVWILDYIVPIITTKKFGGSKYGTWGSTLGLIVGLFFGFVGMIIGPLIGAFVFELIFSRNTEKAFKSALGSFVGFLLSTGIKTMVTLIILGFLCLKFVNFAIDKIT